MPKPYMQELTKLTEGDQLVKIQSDLEGVTLQFREFLENGNNEYCPPLYISIKDCEALIEMLKASIEHQKGQ